MGHELFNHEAAWITQSGVDGHTPLWDLGLDGEGEIVGVADTGVDDRSCFFRDYDYGPTPRNNASSPSVDSKYRKVVQYISYADGLDTEGISL